MKKIKRLVNSFFNNKNPKNDFSFKYIKGSYSQCGEDLLVKYIFDLRGVEKPSYIDIGANDPFFLSNTALFYKLGCRGINIEANPELISRFYKFRPDDININIGIGKEEGEMDFYVMNDPSLSSFSRAECEKYIKTGIYRLVEVLRIKLTTVEKILTRYWNSQFPDFLSIDVEGLDYEILKTIDFNRYYPKVICVEAADYSPIGSGEKRSILIEFLKKNGYYEYANTNLNAIMVKKDFWFI